MGLLLNELPVPSGPFRVGTINVESAVPRQIFGTALLASNSEPALVMESILVTIFYPSNSKNSRHEPFFERPLTRTITGYLKFAQISRGISYVVLPILYVLVAGIRLRSSLDVPLATAPASGKSNSASSSLSSLSKDTTKFPLVIFSHGLSGTRTTYSAYCSNLASHGQIVVGIEHRDGSSPFSAVTLPNGEERLVDYLRMPALRFEGPILSENEFREDQLKMRASEVAAAFKLMESLDSGERVKNLRSSKADLGMWQDRIDFSSSILAGHSFGGATVLKVMREKNPPFTRAITLDPYVDQIPATSPHFTIDKPLLVINSEIFTLWTPHYRKVREMVTNVIGGNSWLITLVGSVHTQFSDINLLSNLINKKSNARVGAAEAMTVFSEASLEFIQNKPGKYLNHKRNPLDFDGRREGEGYPREGNKHMMPDVGNTRYNISPLERKA